MKRGDTPVPPLLIQKKPRRQPAKQADSGANPLAGVQCPSPWAKGAVTSAPPSGDRGLTGCRHLPPPPVRSQKKIPLPQIRYQNAILTGFRHPPIHRPLRQKHNIPIHRHIHQHPSPMTPPPDAQHTVHARHLQVIPLPARLRDPLPRHKPELRTTPGRKPLPLPQKLNPANPHKKSNPRKAEAKDIGSSAPERESQEAKCSSSFV